MPSQTHEGDGYPLEYSGEILNTNNNLDVGNGIYACPEDGLYAFYVASLSGTSGDCFLSLEVDPSLFLFRAAAVEYSGLNHHQSGIMVIAPCLATQESFVETKFSNSHSVEGTNSSRTSTFSGFQIGLYFLS